MRKILYRTSFSSKILKINHCFFVSQVFTTTLIFKSCKTGPIFKDNILLAINLSFIETRQLPISFSFMDIRFLNLFIIITTKRSLRLVVCRSVPGMIVFCSMTAWLRLCIEANYLRHVCCEVLFHSTTNCCNCLSFLGPLLLNSLPITSQMCSKGLRSGERDGYGRTFTMLACKSAIVVRAE